MKTVVIGDIHGRTTWKDIIAKEHEYDKVVFLGDYVSTHENISQQEQIDNLEEILKFKTQNSDKVVLLRGNHDMQHLGYYWAECSGLFKKVLDYMSKNRSYFLNHTQWIYIQDNILFSHAGISQKWMEFDNIKDIHHINNLGPSEKFGFTPTDFTDIYGTSSVQPCTWIRPQTLAKCMVKGYNQVVGHTPVVDGTCLIIRGVNGDIYCCDALPTGYLIIENGKFIPKQL